MAYSQTVYVLDLSPSMAQPRLVNEKSWDPVQQKEVDQGRTITDFEWIAEWLSKKLADEILTSSMSKRFAIITYGGSVTNNIVHTEGIEGYEGVEEIWGPKPADIEMLELLRSLRAREEGDGVTPATGDPISALVVAVRRLKDETWIDKTTRNRIIYLITDGRTKFDNSNVSDIFEQFAPDPLGRLSRDKNGIILKVVGIDFDDPEIPFTEPDKSQQKAENEIWWRNTFADLPEEQFQLTSALSVIEANSGPTVNNSTSVPKNSKMTLGRLEQANQDDDQTLILNVQLYKATTVARPMKQTLISKPALNKPSTVKRNELNEKRMSQLLNSQSQTQSQVGSGSNSSRYQHGNLNSNPNGNASASGSGRRLDEDDDDEPSVTSLPTYRVSRQAPLYREKDKEIANRLIVSKLPLEADEREPEPIKDDDPNLIMAYKLGRDHVEVERVDQFKLATEAGLEILNFYYEEKVPLTLSMGEVSWVVGSDDASKIALSALAKTLRGEILSAAFAKSKLPKEDSKSQSGPKTVDRKVVLVRRVATAGSSAKLGILFSAKHDDYYPSDQNDVLSYVSVPMAQDYRPYPFDSLTSVTLRTGAQLKEHPRLPKEQQLQAMGNLIDNMNLDEEIDDSGSTPWFDVYTSFNPAIHSIKAASLWRVMNPESPEIDLPKPHSQVTRYLHSPVTSKENFKRSMEEAKTALGIKSKVKATKSDYKKREEEEEAQREAEAGETGRKKKRTRNALSDSDTSDEEMTDAPVASSSSSSLGQPNIFNTNSNNQLNLELKQLSLTDPINQYVTKFEDLFSEDADFEDNTDQAEKLTEEMFLVIKLLIRDCKSSNPSPEEINQIKGCLKTVRIKAAEYEMAHKYNNFLKTLKKQLKDPLNFMGRSNKNIFWEKIFKGDVSLSLITEEEDQSEMTEYTLEDAQKFVEIEIEA